MYYEMYYMSEVFRTYEKFTPFVKFDCSITSYL